MPKLNACLPLLVVGLLLGSAVSAEEPKKPDADQAPPEQSEQKAEPQQLDQATIQFFETKVRPVLANSCWDCHGEFLQESGLRLDSLQAMVDGGDRGPAIKLGNAKESLLIRALNHDELLQMPEGDKLPPEEIAALTKWIDEGAPWPNAPPLRENNREGEAAANFTEADKNFWAFQRPKAVAPPAVKQAAWPQAKWDGFVLGRLEEAGLSPAPPAAKRDLIRRAYYDLIGLPPTPEQVQAFLADESPDAFAKVVDELLASPHYGERWGRHWLDVARYADSNGLDENWAFEHIYRYRDWVIRAMNDDMPYNQFVTEQLAGDLIPQREGESADDYIQRVVATGFLSLGPKMIADDDQVKKKLDIVDEQLNTVGQTFMGMTIGCARCHDHKFDPIPTYDYYAMAGIFKSTQTMEHLRVVAPVVLQQLKPDGYDQELAKWAARRDELVEQREMLLSEKVAPLLTHHREALDKYLSAPEYYGLTGFTPNAEQDLVFEAEDPTRGEPIVADYGGARVLYKKATVEHDFEVPADGWYRIYFRYAQQEQREFVAKLNGEPLGPKVGWLVTGGWDAPQQRWIRHASVKLSAGTHTLRLEEVYLHLDKVAVVKVQPQTEGAADETLPPADYAKRHELNANILMEVLSKVVRTGDLSKSPWKPLLAGTDSEEFKAFEKTLSELTAETKGKKVKELVDLLYGNDGILRPQLVEGELPDDIKKQLAERRQAAAAWEKEKPQLVTVMGVKDGKPEDLPVMLRGEYLTPGVQTKRGFLRIIDGEGVEPPQMQGSGRLELARWMTQPDHPLTARVMVNRVWRWHFGSGLVKTPDNFGALGERPTHPELLDYLAVKFVEEDGWSLKKLHRRLMLSATYQMSTQHNTAAAEQDPENRLWWRFPRKRLEAEAIRDAIIYVSGNLNPEMYGSMMPFNDRQYVTGTGSRRHTYENFRRSVYQPIYRSAVYDVLTAFDFPDPATPTGDRSSSIVAPQALLLMNSSLVADNTRRLAERLVAATDAPPAEQVDDLYRRFYNRPAEPGEISAVLAAREQLETQFAAAGQQDAKVRSWQSICRVLLASNEFIYLD